MKFLLTLLAFVTTSQLIGQTNWALDKGHTNIQFTVTHMVVSEVEGDFRDFDGKVTSKSEDFNNSEVEFTAKVASINSGSEGRDKHLKGDDFFNAEKFPDVKFKGKIVIEKKKYYLVGDFTMRDVTKPVKFDVKYNGVINTQRGKKAGFKVTGMVNRFDYGLKWDRTVEAGGSLVVAKEVAINCNIELNEVKPEAGK